MKCICIIIYCKEYSSEGVHFENNLNKSMNIRLFFKLRNKSWKPECVESFNMDWWILVFYPEPEARDKIY
jgi:hypothetical protein